MEKLDKITQPNSDPISYKVASDLELSIERIAEAVNAREFVEAAARIQAILAWHLDALVQQQHATHYLNLLLCISGLRQQYLGDYIDLDEQTRILNNLARPGVDAEIRGKLNVMVSKHDEGDYEGCENELAQCLSMYLPEMAAPSAFELRATAMQVSESFDDQKLFGLLQKIDMAVEDRPYGPTFDNYYADLIASKHLREDGEKEVEGKWVQDIQ